MILSGSSKRNIALFAAVFLLCGFLNVISEDVGFTECSRLYCGVLVLIWALSIQERVTDVRLRNLLLLIAGQILFCSFLQILYDQFFYSGDTVRRYLWYAHYIPMMAISLLCFYLSLCIYRPAAKRLPAACCLPAVLGILLTLGVVTNDMHFFAFSFAGGVPADYDDARRGLLIYVFMTFIMIIVIFSFAVILRKHGRYRMKKYSCLPVIPVLIELIYVVLYILNADPRIGGVRIWEYGEMFSICTVTFLEACIQTGMIPANKDYDKLFSASSYPAVILDNRGDVVYSTSGAIYPFEESEDLKIMRHAISGGSIEWTVDMKYIHLLSRKLAEATSQLNARNAYLAEETRIKREKAEIETRNRLYDGISRTVKAQLSAIDSVLNDESRTLAEKIPVIAVLKAYIKRRSNMELLASSGPLPLGELTAAVTESLEYVRLCGVNTAVSSMGTGAFPAEMIITAYERFEAVTEESLHTLHNMNVFVCAKDKDLMLRIMLEAGSFSYWAGGRMQTEGKERESTGFSERISVTKEGHDVTVTFTFTKGGRA